VTETPMLRTLRRAGWLVLMGLLVEAATLLAPPSPSSFFAFLLGGGLILLGSMLFLWRLARPGSDTST
jgi:F0F1-type ATP synthase assembly protein I